MDQNERIADVILSTDEVFDKPKVLEDKPKDYMATVVLAVTLIDGQLYVIQKAININERKIPANSRILIPPIFESNSINNIGLKNANIFNKIKPMTIRIN